MKRILLIITVIVFSLNISAQELNWHTDAKKAMDIATKNDRPILMFFTGSDWCGWCTRLENNVYKKDAFKKWVEEKKIVLLLLDFPKRSKLSDELTSQNAYFQKLFQVRGFPTNYLVKFRKKVASKQVDIVPLGGRFGYSDSVEKWLAIANQCLESEDKQKEVKK